MEEIFCALGFPRGVAQVSLIIMGVLVGTLLYIILRRPRSYGYSRMKPADQAGYTCLRTGRWRRHGSYSGPPDSSWERVEQNIRGGRQSGAVPAPGGSVQLMIQDLLTGREGSGWRRVAGAGRADHGFNGGGTAVGGDYVAWRFTSSRVTLVVCTCSRPLESKV